MRLGRLPVEGAAAAALVLGVPGAALASTDESHPRAGVIFGGQENDWISGSPDSERIFGLGGDDKISGSGDSDYLFAGSGDDFVNPRDDDARDVVFCGPGEDAVNNIPGPRAPDVILPDCENVVV